MYTYEKLQNRRVPQQIQNGSTMIVTRYHELLDTYV